MCCDPAQAFRPTAVEQNPSIEQLADTYPGAKVRYSVFFGIDLFAFAAAWGKVYFSGSGPDKLPLQFNRLRAGEHNIFWDDIIPPDAQGEATIQIVLFRFPGGIDRLSSTFGVSGSPPPQQPAFIGSSRCMSCHAGFTPGVTSAYAQSGHYFALNKVSSQAPQFPSFSAGVPDPPPGSDWSDSAFVVGGYGWAANFISAGSGLLLTGLNAQYNPPNSRLATPSEFIPYNPDSNEFTCASCHATGYQPGTGGASATWAENGVGCEACHGQGSLHAADPYAAKPPADAAAACSGCHSSGSLSSVESAGGMIDHMQQSEELKISPKNFMACSTCHNPHASAHFDDQAPGTAIIKSCTECHSGVQVGLGMQGLSCTECHMPSAVKAGASITFSDIQGSSHALGDMRSHIFKINAAAGSPSQMFSENGDRLATDSAGSALGITLDFACLGCHRPGGQAARSYTYEQLQGLAPSVHGSR